MEDVDDHPLRPALIRIAVATATALVFALGVYLLLEAARPDVGLVSFSFLLLLPAAITAFVAYVADPWKTRSHTFYLLVPAWLIGLAMVASIVVLREGTVCVVILSPLWAGSAMVGAELTYRLRRRVRDGRSYCLALFAVPLVAMQVEPLIPLPTATATASVVRSIDVATGPDRLWPLLEGIPDVAPHEGRWNLSQDVIGIPRPIGARLVGRGIGADRHAVWGHGIRFRERIDTWRPEREIGWSFAFDDMAGWGYTDRHLLPDNAYFRVERGGYRLTPLPGGRTRVTLTTTYRVTTPVNLYSQLWGELFLGDLENNLLALVKGRAERSTPPPAPATAAP